MATKRVTIELDDELFDTTSLLAEAAAETSLNNYIVESVIYMNNMRAGLPETKMKIQQHHEHLRDVVARVIDKCDRQIAHELDKRGRR